MEESLLRDIKYVSFLLKSSKSKKTIAYAAAGYISYMNLYKLLEYDENKISNDFDIPKVELILNQFLEKEKKGYLDYLLKSGYASFYLAEKLLKIFQEEDFYPYQINFPKRSNEEQNSDNLIDFMQTMGQDVFGTFRDIYLENRINHSNKISTDGLCIDGTIIDSQYILYDARLDVFDSYVISHELGHIIQNRYLRNIGKNSLTGTIYNETVSQYFELLYLQYLKEKDKDSDYLEGACLRSLFDNTISIDLMKMFSQLGLVYTNGTDIIPMFNDTSYLSKNYELFYLDKYQKNIKQYSFSKPLTYFVGHLIAQDFISKYEPIEGLFKLKEFLSQVSFYDLEDNLNKIELLDSSFDDLSFKLKNYRKNIFGGQQ